MHIGIDCRLPAYRLGGISQYVLHLLPALAELDKDNPYTIIHSRKDRVSRVPKNASNFQRAVAWTPCHHRWERWVLATELWRHRFGVLHSPDFIPPAFGAQRFVITVHDLNFIYYPEYLTAESRRYYLEQIEWAVQQAHHISADSEHTRQDLIERLKVSAEKVTTIPLAASPIYEEPPTLEAFSKTLAYYNLPRGFLLFVGTLEPRKNIPTLLHAYAKLRQIHNVDQPLVLVGGKGWLYDQIFATIRQLNLTNCVRHLQGVSDLELSHLYKAAAVLALPSHYEGFGLPPLEAMHCGCPVVTSNRGSLPEVVGDAGILLPPDDVDRWTAILAMVLNDSECRQHMIRAGHLQAKTFSWRRTAQQTLQIYQNV